MEPHFDEVIDSTFVSLTNLTANGPIYLAKEDNVQSEQTFRVIVEVADSVPFGGHPATISVDYSIGRGGTSSVIEFFPSMQRVNFPFTLFHDNFSEGTEAFHVSYSAEDTGESDGMKFDLPGYSPPIALSSETFVIIEDDDRKGLCGILLL